LDLRKLKGCYMLNNNNKIYFICDYHWWAIGNFMHSAKNLLNQLDITVLNTDEFKKKSKCDKKKIDSFLVGYSSMANILSSDKKTFCNRNFSII